MNKELKTLEERELEIEAKINQLTASIDQSTYIASRQKIRKWIRYLHEIIRAPSSSTYRSISKIFHNYEQAKK